MLVGEAVPARATSSRALRQRLFSLLQSCNSIRKVAQIHAQILINGFSQKSYIIFKLLSFYATSGYLQNLLRVIDNIERPSTTVWNQIIRGHARSSAPLKSVEFYNRMVEAGVEPDGFTYSFLLSACARSGLMREGEQVHGRVLANGYCCNVFVQTNLINLYTMAGVSCCSVAYARRVFDDMRQRSVVSWNSLLAGYIRCGDVDGARQAFEEMPERNLVSWTTMIAGCAKRGKNEQALSLFYQMRKAQVELDQVALVAALAACAESGDLKSGRWIHRYIEKKLHVKTQPLLVSLYNALIHMYASCGVIDEAYKIFSDMPEKSTVSWTNIIIGFAKQGHGEEALRVFHLMLSSGENGARPDEITFIGALCACSHTGLVNEGCRLFEAMTRTWGISPRIDHYGCMVDLLSRAGFLNEACKLIETMPMKPSVGVWGALLGGCRLHKNADLASQVSQKLTAELKPDQAAGYLVLLSQVYADAKWWLDVASVRHTMVEMGVRKPPGRSWLQINGAISYFVAGDRSHKHTPLIYKTLGEITWQAQCEGYKLETSDVFTYVED